MSAGPPERHPDGPRGPAARLDAILSLLARPTMPPGFFERQRAQVIARVESGAALAWEAPKGTLALMVTVVGLYLLAGLDVGIDALGAWNQTAPAQVGADPLDSVSLLYLGLAAVALRVVARGDQAAAPGQA